MNCISSQKGMIQIIDVEYAESRKKIIRSNPMTDKLEAIRARTDKPRVSWCWYCGNKLRGKHFATVTLSDGHERIVHKECADIENPIKEIRPVVLNETWQHEETGRICELPKGQVPGRRWYKVERKSYEG